ncbi:hypothetical protein RH915_03420 [Serpentinicella sp. ANB-PHB4]|uniref:hypothetical protein n=1 Tax=Serpentinicella sp. ANB-PHB4 TaxID=3074076 RepID=UPI002854512F|nr:hypothetical protein [Serpentinicella sp. ANB-PHB4]MDR5658533.1 hypothetical protein [Serpentinicella sp. ANB-PHB4]
MIKLLTGQEGSGKTKKLIGMVNNAIKTTKGNLVFLDYDNNQMYKIDYKVRFMGISEYNINDDTSLYGFICGIIASNYDVENIYIDRLFNITNKEVQELETFFNKLAELELKYNVNFIMTIGKCKDDLPEFLEKYMIE